MSADMPNQLAIKNGMRNPDDLPKIPQKVVFNESLNSWLENMSCIFWEKVL